MVIFNGYVKLPEGNPLDPTLTIDGVGSGYLQAFPAPPALKRSRLGSRKKEPSVYHAVPVLVALRYQHESTMIS